MIDASHFEQPEFVVEALIASCGCEQVRDQMAPEGIVLADAWVDDLEAMLALVPY
jgi:hypothetical protein